MFARFFPRPYRAAGPASLLVGLALSLASVLSSATTDFTEFSLEELSLVRISTLGRKQTTILDTPAAAYVVTGEDLHRAGVLNFAEALRLVPGIQVGQINSFDYAIGIRGFSDSTSNKMLLLMDGRSLYSPTFSGVLWNYQELMMEDLERIEVLRGPGASLWGANAMNGVINIVTKNAHDTLGSLVTVATGDELDVSAAVRHGWKVSNSAAMRVYAKYTEQGSYGVTLGSAANGWDNRLVGSRYDWRDATGRTLTLLGEYRSLVNQSLTALPTLSPPYAVLTPEARRAKGGNLSAHYTVPVFERGEISVLASYENNSASQVKLEETRDTYAVEVQMTLPAGTRHEVISGLTYNLAADSVNDTPYLKYSVQSAHTVFGGAFIQDEFAVVPDQLYVTAGTKLERNSFSGWELQPSVRALWHLSPTQRVWVAASRAARTPTRSERSLDIFAGVTPPNAMVPFPLAIRARGASTFSSEYVNAFELGYRLQPNLRLTFELSLFSNSYQHLRGLITENTEVVFAPSPHVELNYTADNHIHGRTQGGEFSTRWQASSTLLIEGSVSTMQYDLKEDRRSLFPDPSIPGYRGTTPKTEFRLRTSWDPAPKWQLDLIYRHVDTLTGPGIPAHDDVDARVAWKPATFLEIDAVGRNLSNRRHEEAPDTFIDTQVSEISRSFFLRATFRY